VGSDDKRDAPFKIDSDEHSAPFKVDSGDGRQRMGSGTKGAAPFDIDLPSDRQKKTPAEVAGDKGYHAGSLPSVGGIREALGVIDDAVGRIKGALVRMHTAMYGSDRHKDYAGSQERGAALFENARTAEECKSLPQRLCALGPADHCFPAGVETLAQIFCERSPCAESNFSADSEEVGLLQTRHAGWTAEFRIGGESRACRTISDSCMLICRHAFSLVPLEEERCKKDCASSTFSKFEAVLTSYRDNCCATSA